MPQALPMHYRAVLLTLKLCDVYVTQSYHFIQGPSNCLDDDYNLTLNSLPREAVKVNLKLRK